MGAPNWQNQTIWTGDNLDILRGMNSETVDLVYLDPPFNSNKNYAAPIGSKAAGAAFKDTWTLSDVDEAWHGEVSDREPVLYSIIDAAGHAHGKSMKSYLIMMAVRLMELRRILKDTGSLYLHCDPTASHYLKTLMDAIFEPRNFRNEIIWHYRRWPAKQRNFQRMHDIILFYSSKKDQNIFCELMNPLSPGTQKRWRGKKSRVAFTEEGERLVTQMTDEDSTGAPMDDVWDIPVINSQAKERIGYPTQKPLALLDRIIKASSREGDVILDPFCGCATACVAAQFNNRHWVGIDISPKAFELVKVRLDKEVPFFNKNVIHRTDFPQRTDLSIVLNYRTHKHTLFGKQEGVCNGCRQFFQFRNFTIDHIVPQAKGGPNHLDNLQLLCGACNSMKGTGTQEELLAKLKREGIR